MDAANMAAIGAPAIT